MSQQHVDGSVRKSRVEIFTPEEHRILAEWIGQEPHPAAASRSLKPGRSLESGCSLKEALERLGVDRAPTALYEETAPAVAFIVLEGVEDELPNWGISDGEGVTLTRAYRPKHLAPQRRVAIVPQHLFTLNWADSGPGFSWPAAYYCTWVPLYDRYVVTSSADCPEMFGYCDIAIGHFGQDETLKEGSRRVITADWQRQRDECMQARWEYLFASGQVSDAEAEAWADSVWPEGREW